MIDGDNEVTKLNAGDGYMHGVDLSFRWTLPRNLRLSGAAAKYYGELDTYLSPGSAAVREVVDRLPPLAGNLGLHWSHPTGKVWVEGLALFADRADQLSSRDLADTDRIPPGGTPGYAVFSLRSGVTLSPRVKVSLALENLLNRDYRVHGSGQNEAGTNFILGFDLGI